MHARVLGIAVRRSMEATDWLNHKEPRAPRLVCDFILERAAGGQAVGCLWFRVRVHASVGGGGRWHGCSSMCARP